MPYCFSDSISRQKEQHNTSQNDTQPYPYFSKQQSSIHRDDEKEYRDNTPKHLPYEMTNVPKHMVMMIHTRRKKIKTLLYRTSYNLFIFRRDHHFPCCRRSKQAPFSSVFCCLDHTQRYTGRSSRSG